MKERTHAHFFCPATARMSLLYISAAIPQLIWPYIAFFYREETVKYLGLPLIGYSMLAVWVGALVCSVAMIFIGIRLFVLSRKAERPVAQTRSQAHKYGLVKTILVLGMVIDLLGVLFVFFGENTLSDKSAVVFFSALMGGKILQANMEAVFQYFNL